MRETLSADQYQALYRSQKKSDAQHAVAKDVVSRSPLAAEGSLASRIRQRLRAMGDYHDIPREKTEAHIKSGISAEEWTECTMAELLERYAKAVGIPDKKASFYIRQQQASGMI